MIRWRDHVKETAPPSGCNLLQSFVERDSDHPQTEARRELSTTTDIAAAELGQNDRFHASVAADLNPNMTVN